MRKTETPQSAPRDKAYGYPDSAFDPANLPDVDHVFISPEDIAAFESALQAPDPIQALADEAASPKSLKSMSSVNLTKRDSQTGTGMEDDVASVVADLAAQSGEFHGPASPSQHGTFITAQNDWAPVNPKYYGKKRGSRKRRRRAKQAVEGILGTRTKDETREGYLYQLAKWPLLIFVFGWLLGLVIAYLSTRLYIWVYEHFFTWRGKREGLRRKLRKASNYRDWVAGARELDSFLGRQTWREENDFAYYDSKTVKRVWDQMKKTRVRAELAEPDGQRSRAIDELKALTEACVKNNFVGIENARLYSQTYYGTKNLVQNFTDEGKYHGENG